MSSELRYMVIEESDSATVTTVLRISPPDGPLGLSLCYYSKDANEWVEDPSLIRYVFEGDAGARMITEAEARAFVESHGGTF